jgi:prepilin-type N-terminal cleavage/methylation domain-containing protein
MKLSRLNHSQAGFSLLEITLAMALAAMLSIGYIYNQTRDQALNTAKAQAGYYLLVNDAVGKYMLTFYDDLGNIPATCSTVLLTAGDAPAAGSANCQFSTGTNIGSAGPVNAFQPTVDELKKLNMLDSSFIGGFLWSTTLVVQKPDGTKPVTYGTRVQRFCDNVLMTGLGSTCTTKPQYKSITFNTQPFVADNASSFFGLSRYEKMDTALAAMGADGLMSLEPQLDTDGKGMLYSVGKQISLDNPILYKTPSVTATNGKGVEGILAVNNSAEVRCTAK